MISNISWTLLGKRQVFLKEPFSFSILRKFNIKSQEVLETKWQLILQHGLWIRTLRQTIYVRYTLGKAFYTWNFCTIISFNPDVDSPPPQEVWGSLPYKGENWSSKYLIGGWWDSVRRVRLFSCIQQTLVWSLELHMVLRALSGVTLEHRLSNSPSSLPGVAPLCLFSFFFAPLCLDSPRYPGPEKPEKKWLVATDLLKCLRLCMVWLVLRYRLWILSQIFLFTVSEF